MIKNHHLSSKKCKAPLHPTEVNEIWVCYASNDTEILVLCVQGLYYYNVHQELPFRNYLHYFEYFQFLDREKSWRHSVFSYFSSAPDVFQSDLEIIIYTLDLM